MTSLRIQGSNKFFLFLLSLYLKFDMEWDSKDFHVFTIASFIGGFRIISSTLL